MSFVIAAPEMVTAAATDLASIGSTLNAANAAAAAPTTGILVAAEDEVSAAVAELFGAHGRAFQAMSAQAAAFHSEFVNLMTTGAGAYLGTEIANAEQVLAHAAGAPVRALLGGGAPVGSGSGGAVSAVVGGLGSLGGNVNSILSGARPGLPPAQTGFDIRLFPGLMGAGTGGNGSTDIVGPYVTLIENTGANLQSLVAGWLADPFPFLRQVIANQIGYAQLVATALTTGNPSLISAIPGDIAHNISNVIGTLTDFSITFGFVPDTSNLPLSLLNSTITLQLGLPLALGLDAIGSPITTMFAIQSSETAFAGALQSGNFPAALTALVDAPAVITNGFLNGHATLALEQSFAGNLAIPVTGGVTIEIPVTEQAALDLPLGGVLTPLAPVTAPVGPVTIGPVVIPQFLLPLPATITVGPFPIPVPPFSVGPFTIPLPPVTVGPLTLPLETAGPFVFTVQGTPLGGIIPALVLYAPQQLALAIGAPASPTPLL